jgi:hypothetical protein
LEVRSNINDLKVVSELYFLRYALIAELSFLTMNIQLAEVLPGARQLSAVEKLKLIRILAEDLDTTEDIAPLEPFKT